MTAVLGMVVHRLGAVRVGASSMLVRRVLIFGAGEHSLAVRLALDKSDPNVQIVGFYPGTTEEIIQVPEDRVLPVSCSLTDTVRNLDVDEIVVDPGIGFGKTTEHNLALLAALDRLGDIGRPVLVGVSRKRFIGELAGGAPPTERLGGTIAAGLAAVARGASILRVHDVAAHVQALNVWHAISDVQRTPPDR
jgi:dihydropteroate synthase